RSYATDHFFALPHAAGKLEREDVDEDEADAEREEGPALAELRCHETEAGEDGGGERDDEPGDVLSGATRFHARGDDHRHAPGCDEIEERQHEERVQQRRRQHALHTRRAVPVGGQRVGRGKRDDAGDHHRHDHPHELPEDYVEVAYRSREEGDQRAVLFLGGEGRGDERDAGERWKEDALQSEADERHIAGRSGRDAAIREDEEERDHDEDPRPKQRGAVEEHLPADLAPGDQPPLHRRASARMLRYASSSERSSADSVMTRTPASSSARSAAGFTAAGSSAANRSAVRPSRALALSASIPARWSAS